MKIIVVKNLMKRANIEETLLDSIQVPPTDGDLLSKGTSVNHPLELFLKV